MNTSTIYNALRRCESRQSEIEMVDGFGRVTQIARVLVRQQGKFRNELFRRMDERDAMVLEKSRAWAALAPGSRRRLAAFAKEVNRNGGFA